MTIDTIHTAITEWADARGITITATKQALPPTFFDMSPLLTPSEEEDYTGAGLHVSIETSADSSPDSRIGFWIPDSLKKGCYISMTDGDAEISHHWIPEFSTEKELLAFIDDQTDLFFLQHIQEATLDAWLAKHGISYKVVEADFCGDAGHYASGDLQNWLLVEFRDAKGYDVTLGVSGKGDAATFDSNEDGFLDFDKLQSKLTTREALAGWLDTVIASVA